jgi:hypothetical protein
MSGHTWKAPLYRKSYQRKYGSRCFLRPKDLSYPICTRNKIDCQGLRAANYYLRLQKRKTRDNDKDNHRKNRTMKHKIRHLKNIYCNHLKKK